MNVVKKWSTEWWALRYQNKLAQDIMHHKIIFNGHYEDKHCGKCGCDEAQILFTPLECHMAKSCCANCGKFYRWISKNECMKYC